MRMVCVKLKLLTKSAESKKRSISPRKLDNAFVRANLLLQLGAAVVFLVSFQYTAHDFRPFYGFAELSAPFNIT